jgi:hypothetical protein
MNKKVALTGICLAAVCIFISTYMLNWQSEKSNIKDLNLKSSEVAKINISSKPSFFKEFDIANEEQISSVVDYLTMLYKKETRLNPGDYSGGGYLIKIKLENGSTREFMHYGNKFFIEQNSFTYEISYEEAIKFDMIVANILESNDIKIGRSSVTGNVVSVNTDKSGRNLACIIKDKDNTTYNIKLENANIIDATGKGWLILHKGDVVKIFCEGNHQSSNNDINALTVYIKTAAE